LLELIPLIILLSSKRYVRNGVRAYDKQKKEAMLK
jgi:hypothetical protein